ncbi:MAPEG family protein [Zestomonas carbonaria]|uniref:MAPEG family protein n=1 Tax=Zestomonas carbonaria TaxID=2762745 RepID=A0A7U7I870_9GAMM|nr:MAPEG family protein [Pseudomonas carbonaria]CAD5106416.1 hypothetical protein PSEWESI4_00679 [Pseudomonas carbonaria]
MTVAFWCVLIAIILPYACVAIAKFSGGDYGPSANHAPREFLAGLSGWRQRAHHAQLNSFEIAPAFAAAVIIAHLAGGASQALIDSLAVAFIISRLFYIGCYIADWAPVRSVVWFMGVGLIVAMFVVAA